MVGFDWSPLVYHAGDRKSGGANEGCRRDNVQPALVPIYELKHKLTQNKDSEAGKTGVVGPISTHDDLNFARRRTSHFTCVGASDFFAAFINRQLFMKACLL